MGIGMESGLFCSDGRLFDVCACAIYDGKHTHVGYSCAWELPPAVACARPQRQQHPPPTHPPPSQPVLKPAGFAGL